MVFSSLIFIFFLLPIALIFYHILPKQLHNSILLAVSLFFYAWGEPTFIVLMVFSALVNYLFGRLIGRARVREKVTTARVYLWLSVVWNLALLGFFKYAMFMMENLRVLFGSGVPVPQIHLPIGISFFTFQIMSYVIDVWRGNVAVQKNFGKVLLYAMLFPQLVAGPIVRYETVEQELAERHVTRESFTAGVTRFVIGLSKKILIANSVAVAADAIFDLPQGELAVATAWVGVLAYTLQIYFDFSGYSDMAIGLGAMFGFSFPDNFRYPYLSSSVSGFWRRWHMTLGSWFRDYVYFPMGGSRCSTWRMVFNLFVVWSLTGLWHGASWSFVAWGVYYFVFITIEKLLHKGKGDAYHPLGNLYTLLVVAVGWVLFRADTLSEAFGYLKSMIGLSGNALSDYNTSYYFTSKIGLFAVAVIAALPIIPFIKKKFWDHRNRAVRGVTAAASAIGITALFVVCTARLVSDSYNPFIYFQF